MRTATPRQYFEGMYEDDPDPWGFETRWYERRKYDLCMAALPERRYRCAFEPGCSVGVLTEALAQRCERVIASDMIPSALERARRRLVGFGHVTVENLIMPQDWPSGSSFDLVVLSELAYYFDTASLTQLVSLATSSLESGGTLLGAHWRGATDYPLLGEEAHRIIASSPELEALSHFQQAEFVLDVWRRR